MSVVADIHTAVSRNTIGLRPTGNSFSASHESSRFERLSLGTRDEGPRIDSFGARVLRAIGSAVSAAFVGLIFAVSIALTILMIAAMLVTLVCGLACHA